MIELMLEEMRFKKRFENGRRIRLTFTVGGKSGSLTLRLHNSAIKFLQRNNKVHANMMSTLNQCIMVKNPNKSQNDKRLQNFKKKCRCVWGRGVERERECVRVHVCIYTCQWITDASACM